MKSNTRSKRNSKPRILATGIFLAILVIVAISTSLALNFSQGKTVKQQSVDSNPGNVVNINNNPPTTDQKAAGDAQKPSDKVTNNDLGISITSIDTTSDPINIRSIISGTTSNDGVCKLTLTKGLSVVTKTSDTYALPSTSTCKGFSISKSELSIGTWKVELSVTINDKESAMTDSFTLE